jgi:hypothetical protein
MLHDYIAATGIIYRWHAKMAKIREKTVYRQLDHQTSGTISDEGEDDDSDDDDSDVDGEQYTSYTPSGFHQRRPNNGSGNSNTTPNTALLMGDGTDNSSKATDSRSDGYTTFGQV